MNIRTILLVFFAFAAASSANAQCLTLNDCAATGLQEACDLTTNDPLLWNDPVFWAAGYATHDLPEVSFEHGRSVTNTCANGTTVGFRLFLDLDGNGTQESVLQSADLAPAGSIWFNNSALPNYQGGVAVIFDSRAVPNGEKYQFGIEQSTTGNLTSVQLRWTTVANPGVFVPVQLPFGVHKIQWIFSDGGGGEVICEQNWTIKDCKKPTIVCLNGLSANIMPTQQIDLWATDFLQYAEDNYSASSNIKIAIVKSSQSTGSFPVDSAGLPVKKVIFTCAELGLQPVELWAMDEAGNVDYCETYVIVQDGLGNCSGSPHVVNICSKLWCNDAVISNMQYDFQGTTPGIPPTTIFLPVSNACGYFSSNAFPLAGNFTITPYKDDDPLNGVTLLDLVAISKHILGLEPLSTYAMIAADANKSNSITTFDIVELKKLLLGIYSELPNNTSWRFVDGDFVFFNPANPFQMVFPESSTLVNIQSDTLEFSFVAVKIGDVDCSAIPGFQGEVPQERSVQRILTIPDATLLAGETLDLPIRTSEDSDWLALQIGLRFDPQSLVIEAITPGNLPEMEASSFAFFQTGLVNIAWFQPIAQSIAAAENIATIRVRALQAVHLKDAISLHTGGSEGLIASGYDGQENNFGLQLEFQDAQQPSQEPTGIFAPQPNPSKANVTIPVRLAQTENVRLELTDVHGRILYNVQKNLERGTQLLDIPADVFRGAGMYGWRVRAGATVASGTIVRY